MAVADFGDTLATEILNGGPTLPTQAQTTVLVNGNSVLTYVANGVRYAAIGIVPADAQMLLTTAPNDCNYP